MLSQQHDCALRFVCLKIPTHRRVIRTVFGTGQGLWDSESLALKLNGVSCIMTNSIDALDS